MKFISIEIDGYRRFETKQQLQLDCRMVALLGPNEAGKTSVLRALQSLNTNVAFAGKGPSQDLSRGLEIPADHVVLRARFLLENKDIEALSDWPEVSSARWLVVEKRADGVRKYQFWPKPTRNLEFRAKTIDSVRPEGPTK